MGYTVKRTNYRLKDTGSKFPFDYFEKNYLC